MERPASEGAPGEARPLALAAAVAAVAAMLAVPPLVGLRVDYGSFSAFAQLGALFGLVVAYAHWRGMATIRAVVETMLLVLLLTVPVLVLSYCAMRLGRPLADETLGGMDAVLGFDAIGIVRWVDARPLVAAPLWWAYVSFSPQILFLPPLLALLGERDRAYRFVAGFVAVCVVSIALSAPFPSVGAFAYRGIGPEGFAGVDPYFGYHFLQSFRAVRTDPGFVLSAGVASGIITFPSIHAGVATLCAWAAWPSRLLRWPLLLLNAAMFASAVTHGAHYVVDTLAGGVVALLVVTALARRRPEPARAAGRPATA